jgi:cell division protein ZapA (FtsZ GTPase activity inhibitor)
MINNKKKEEVDLSISVTIADRSYKLTIAKDEEESVRKAAKKINDEVENMQKQYKNKDKQDLLAMIALLSKNEEVKHENNSALEEKLSERLEEIDNLLKIED